jgi:hypothetical protein
MATMKAPSVEIPADDASLIMIVLLGIDEKVDRILELLDDETEENDDES